MLRAPAAGTISWQARISHLVQAGEVLGTVAGAQVRAPFPGLVRGLVADRTAVPAGLKIGDVDPRADTDWQQISYKALAIGGGVLEAVLTWLHGAFQPRCRLTDGSAAGDRADRARTGGNPHLKMGVSRLPPGRRRRCVRCHCVRGHSVRSTWATRSLAARCPGQAASRLAASSAAGPTPSSTHTATGGMYWTGV